MGCRREAGAASPDRAAVDEDVIGAVVRRRAVPATTITAGREVKPSCPAGAGVRREKYMSQGSKMLCGQRGFTRTVLHGYSHSKQPDMLCSVEV